MQTNLARKHILFHHDPRTTDGWITLARRDPSTHRFKQYHYRPEELASILTEWMGEDVYFSQNSFYKPQRRIDNIRQLRSLYVDLDVYRLNLTPEWVLGKLEFEYFGQTIPDPNMVIFSGRGLVLIWHLVPVPYMAMPLWRAVENHLTDLLKSLGADTKATDPTRIFRLAGTINSKNGSVVHAEQRHTYRYDLHELQYEYLPELTPSNQAQKKKGRKSKVLHLFNVYTLHLTRARDIAKLVQLRNGDVEGYRETICFLYRYFTCCYTSDPEQALVDTLDLNGEFIHPLPVKEVTRATKSAEKAWEAKSSTKADEAAKAMGYPGAGYRLKNTTIIEWLDITPEEQRELSTIIGPQEKRRRKRVQYQIDKEKILKKKEIKRRQEGIIPRAEYLSQADKKREEILRVIKKNPQASIRKIAEMTGYSRSQVQRVKTAIAE